MNIDYKLMAELAEQYEYEYQVIDLYGKLIANKLDKEFGIFVGFDESSDCFNIDALGKKIYFRDVKDYDSLKKIHSQFDDDAKAERLYNSNNLLNSRKMNYLFNKIKKFPEALKGKEKLLIKSLLIEKNQ